MRNVVLAAHDPARRLQEVPPRCHPSRVRPFAGNRPSAHRRRHQRFAVGSNVLVGSGMIGYYDTVRIGDDSVVNVQRVVSLRHPREGRRAASSPMNVWSVG